MEVAGEQADAGAVESPELRSHAEDRIAMEMAMAESQQDQGLHQQGFKGSGKGSLGVVESLAGAAKGFK